MKIIGVERGRDDVSMKSLGKILTGYTSKSSKKLMKIFDELYKEGDKLVDKNDENVPIILGKMRMIVTIIIHREGELQRFGNYRMSGGSWWSNIVALLLKYDW